MLSSPSFVPINTETVSPAPTSLQGSRILFALDSREETMFFTERPATDLGASLCISPRDNAYRGTGWRELLEEFSPTVLVSCWSTPRLPDDWLSHPECSLRYLNHLCGTVRHLIPRRFLEQGGRASNWGGLVANQVAEHALLLTLGCLRKIPVWDGTHRDCLATSQSLFGRSVGLHGFGQVARMLTKLLKPFDVNLQAFSSGVPHELMRAHGVTPAAGLKELFERNDVVIECEALTPASHGSVTAEVLAALKDGATFVNVGRGLVVDEDALIREAMSGRIRIGLDVLAVEPMPADSPLRDNRNVIYSPHIAGPTGDRIVKCGEAALENIQRFAEGRPLLSEVTLEIYDRST